MKGKNVERSVYVYVLPSGVPDFEILNKNHRRDPDLSGPAPHLVRFAVKFSQRPGKEIKFFSYHWDMGDGTVYERTSRVTHWYMQEGEYQVKLTITSGDGKSLTKTVNVSVGPKPELKIDFKLYTGKYNPPPAPATITIKPNIMNYLSLSMD